MMKTRPAQCFPCELEDSDGYLNAELNPQGYLELTIEIAGSNDLPFVGLGYSQIDNLIQYLHKVKDAIQAH